MWHHDEREKVKEKKTNPTPQKLEKFDTIIPWFRALDLGRKLTLQGAIKFAKRASG